MRLFLYVSSFLLVNLLFSSCACNKDCLDCYTLDEDNCDCFVDLSCQCNDGIQNGNETGIDCGGDCDPCFECLSDYCSLLSGATSIQPKSNIKWISVLAGGDGTSPDDGSWKFTFFSDGIVFENDDGQALSGTWAFDDQISPTAIVVNYNNPPDTWPNPQNIPLLRLDEDTLGLHSGTWKYYFIKE